jgi:hypothetical protein
MSERRIHDDELHSHYVPFSCYKKQHLPAHDRSKQIAPGAFDSQLTVRDSPWSRRGRACTRLMLRTRPSRRHADSVTRLNRLLCLRHPDSKAIAATRDLRNSSAIRLPTPFYFLLVCFLSLRICCSKSFDILERHLIGELDL